MNASIRFEPEVYDIARQVFRDEASVTSFLNALRSTVKGLTVTIEIKPEYFEEKGNEH